MLLQLILSAIPDPTASADKIAAGLDKSPVAYIAAMSLIGNMALLVWMVREMKDARRLAERLGGIIEMHNESTRLLDKAVAFVMAQQPQRRRAAAVPIPDVGPTRELPAEEKTASLKAPKP